MLQNSDLCRQIIFLCYDSKVAGHPRCQKTLELVSQNYQWSQMLRYIEQYISTCDLCLYTKPIQHFPVGKLYPLLVLETQQNTISVKKSPLHSDSHNSNYRKSSKAIPPLCLKALQTSTTSCFGLQTAVCHLVH